MASYPQEGTVLYSAKDNVRLYVNASKTSKRSDEVFNRGQIIGTTTGDRQSNSDGTWFKIIAIIGYKKANAWNLLVPFAGPAIYGSQLLNQGVITNDFWMRVEDADYVIEENTSSDAASLAADAAAKKAAQKQAILDSINTPVKNPNLTANGGGGSSQSNWAWYLVGGVLVFVAGLVVWKLGQSKKRQANPLPSTQPQLAGIQKPKKLKK